MKTSAPTRRARGFAVTPFLGFIRSPFSIPGILPPRVPALRPSRKHLGRPRSYVEATVIQAGGLRENRLTLSITPHSKSLLRGTQPRESGASALEMGLLPSKPI
jgi:hypothetical protein